MNKNKRHFIFILTILLGVALCPHVAQAEKLSAETLYNLQKELKEVQKRSVSVTRDIKRNHGKLDQLNDKIETLEAEEDVIQKRLEDNQLALAQLIRGLQKLKRTPPEALFITPGEPEDIARSAMVLSHIVPGLKEKAEVLKKDIDQLQLLKIDLETKRRDVLDIDEKLQREQKALQALLAKRETIFKETNEDYEEQQKQARKLAEEARSLRDFVESIREKPETNNAAVKAFKPQIPAPGSPRLPVSGIIQVHYNGTDAFGAKSQGIEIIPKKKEFAVAPMGGIVRFAGTFKNYGQMVIIEHKNGYHSLVAGLEKIDTLVGQKLIAGEPIGVTGSAKPKIYYELRHKGKPVDPAQKIKGMS